MTDRKYETLEDGSIDQAFYARRTRRMRSVEAHGLAARVRRLVGSLSRRPVVKPARRTAG